MTSLCDLVGTVQWILLCAVCMFWPCLRGPTGNCDWAVGASGCCEPVTMWRLLQAADERGRVLLESHSVGLRCRCERHHRGHASTRCCDIPLQRPFRNESAGEPSNDVLVSGHNSTSWSRNIFGPGEEQSYERKIPSEAVSYC